MKNQAIEKSSGYLCNEVYFEPNTIPEDKRFSGINFFANRVSTRKNFVKAIWPGSISNEEKSKVILTLSDSYIVQSNTERLGNLFLLSLLHRFINVITASLKLSIDQSNLKNSHKYAGYLILSILPAIFLVYVVGYPPLDLLMNSCISQATAISISYLSLKAGNFLRSVDLISEQKEFSKTSYAGKIITSFLIDIGLTLLWHGNSLYIDPFKQHDNYHLLRYCVNILKKHTETISFVVPATPLISIIDKCVWTAGRLALDGGILLLNSLGKIKDIRSPFVNAFKNHELIIVDKLPKRTHLPRKEKFNKKIQEQNNYNDQEIATATPVSYNLNNNLNNNLHANFEPHKTKIKSRNSSANIIKSKEVKDDGHKEFTTSTKITVKDYTFYKMENQYLPPNSWGVIKMNKYKGNEDIYEKSLASGNMSNKHSAIKFIKDINSYSIRPKTFGDRILGKLYVGMRGLKELFALGEALEIYQELKKADPNINEPNIIFFNKRVKHENITR